MRKTVEIVTGARLGVAEVLDYGAELVVVATGSYWADDGMSGITFGPLPGTGTSASAVLTPEQVVLAGKRPDGERVVVYDCEGYFMGAGLAELLAAEGRRVVLVTPHELVAPLCYETLEGYQLRQHLHEAGVEMLTETAVQSIEDGAVRCAGPFGQEIEIPTDSVVLVTQRLPRDELYRKLSATPADERLGAGVEGVYRIGDCVAPRMLGDAIFDGHRLGREIDSADPSVPLPYLRERQVAAAASLEGLRS